MKKNVASQKIGAQMITAADGTAFTSTVTVYVTIDAGTQAIGSVGSGVCTHEGNGYHTYAPSQAETNGDLISFTFIGTGAIPTSVQVYTAFPQSVDHASAIAVIDGIVDDILVDTAVIGAAGAGLTALATQASVDVIDGIVDNILIDTAEIGAAGAGLTVLATASALATAQGNITDILADTNELQVDDVPGLIAALNDLDASTVLTTQMTEAYAADGVAPTIAQALHQILSFLQERSVSGTTLTCKKLDGSTTAMTFTLSDATSPVSLTRAT